MSLILAIRNITALDPISDYEYQVLVGDGSVERSKLLTVGRVSGHARADGYKALLKQVLADIEVQP